MGLQPMKNACMLHVAGCMLRAACGVLHVACWMLNVAWCMFHVAATEPSYQAKSKFDEKGHDLKVVSDIIYFICYFFFFLKTFFCFANIPFQFKNLLQKWKLVSLSIWFSGISGHILEKKVASTKKKEGIFFSFSRKKGVHFFKLKGHIFFMIVLCWCMKCVK